MYQDVNEQNRWVSAIRKACLTNRDMIPVYHPGAFKNGKWTCCRTPASQGLLEFTTTTLLSTTWCGGVSLLPSPLPFPPPSLSLPLTPSLSLPPSLSLSLPLSLSPSLPLSSEPGCSQCHRGITMGDWRDPLDPDLDAQIIFSQYLQGRPQMIKKYSLGQLSEGT